jgi:ABC-2 type transport system permease protein
MLILWKGLDTVVGGTFVLSASLLVGLISNGMMGYAATTAQDRGRGVFQRLRVTPAPTWLIMMSRIVIQIIMIMIMTILVLIVAQEFNHIHITLFHALLTILIAIVGSSVFLGLGQAVVGLIRSADAVNAAARMIYAILAFGGAVAVFSPLGSTIETIIRWSPYGTVQTILVAALQNGTWTSHIWFSLLVTILYALGFTAIGIKWFQWNTQ